MYAFWLTISHKDGDFFTDEAQQAGMNIKDAIIAESETDWYVSHSDISKLQEFIYRWDNHTAHTFFDLVEYL